MTREQNRKSAMKRIELEIAACTTFPAVTRSDNYVIPDRNILSTYFLTVFNPSRSPLFAVPLAVLWSNDSVRWRRLGPIPAC